MKIKLYSLLLLLFLTFSCGQKNNNSIADNTDESVFQEVSRTKSQFDKIGNSYQYLYKGNLKNISSNIFDEVNTTVEVEFLLENGNVITQNDYQTTLFGGGMDFKYSWKPKEILPINDNNNGLKSEFIPSRYKDYPIKKVVAVLYFKTTDIINQTKNAYQSSIDITKEWNKIK